MKVICEYCGNYLDSTEEKCPSCGAPNSHFARTASDSPKTIEQLKEFCRQKNIPLETLHMHIGENYTEPKAFGIYRDPNTGRFIVYKNKPDGSRAIRYEGADEAYAVNEIYMKIKDLILDSRRNSPTSSSPSPVRSSSGMGERLKRLKWWHWVIIILVLAFLWYMGKNPGRGSSSGHYSSGSYYSYDDSDGSPYGYSSDDWSSYDDDDDDSFFSWGSEDDDDWSSYDDWDSDDDYSWSDSYDFSYDDWDSDW